MNLQSLFCLLFNLVQEIAQGIPGKELCCETLRGGSAVSRKESQFISGFTVHNIVLQNPRERRKERKGE